MTNKINTKYKKTNDNRIKELNYCSCNCDGIKTICTSDKEFFDALINTFSPNIFRTYLEIGEIEIWEVCIGHTKIQISYNW